MKLLARSLSVLVVLGCGSGLASGTALADTVPFAATAITPADGSTIAPAQYQSFVMSTSARPSFMWVEVATQPTLGQDGTLAQEYTLTMDQMTEGDAFPDRYTATPPMTAINGLPPGTYYWQANYTSVDAAPAPTYWQANTHVSPIFKFVVAEPAPVYTYPPPKPKHKAFLSKATARATVPRLIRRETHHPAHHLKRSCRRKSRTKINCNASWTTTKWRSRSTWIYSGTMKMEANFDSGVAYAFEGVRARARCIDRRSVKACVHDVYW